MFVETANKRLQEGGFDLRSWSSNSSELNSRFERDGRASDPGSSFGKVLGYTYNKNNDTFFNF